jgi:hypothetical protein
MERPFLSYPQRTRGQILLIGDDLSLLNSRRMVLESAGYLTRCLPSCMACEENLIPGFDLVILCHTIHSANVKQIVTALRRRDERIPLLLLMKAEGIGSDRMDGIARSTCDPEILLEAISRLTGSKASCDTGRQARAWRLRSHIGAA